MPIRPPFASTSAASAACRRPTARRPGPGRSAARAHNRSGWSDRLGTPALPGPLGRDVRRARRSAPVLAAHARACASEPGAVHEGRVGDQLAVGLRRPRVLRRTVRVEPVPELLVGQPEAVRRGLRRSSRPTRVMLGSAVAQHRQVAAAHRHLPRDDAAASPQPAMPASSVRQDVRHDDGHLPVRRAGRRAGPRASRRRTPRLSCNRGAVAAKTCASPGPPEPLVALRAVGRHRQEVAALAPHDVLVQLRQARGRCRRTRRSARGRSARRPPRPARTSRSVVDLAVAEAVEGEPAARARARPRADDVGVGRLRRAQRRGAQRAVHDDLGVPHDRPCPGDRRPAAAPSRARFCPKSCMPSHVLLAGEHLRTADGRALPDEQPATAARRPVFTGPRRPAVRPSGRSRSRRRCRHSRTGRRPWRSSSSPVPTTTPCCRRRASISSWASSATSSP